MGGWRFGASLDGGGGTNRQNVCPLKAAQLNSPYAMQSRVPTDSLNRRVAPQGEVGGKRDREIGGVCVCGGGVKRSECTAGWLTSVTPCFQFPWRPNSHYPPQPLPSPSPLGQRRLTTRSQHGSR